MFGPLLLKFDFFHFIGIIDPGDDLLYGKAWSYSFAILISNSLLMMLELSERIVIGLNYKSIFEGVSLMMILLTIKLALVGVSEHVQLLPVHAYSVHDTVIYAYLAFLLLDRGYQGSALPVRGQLFFYFQVSWKFLRPVVR